MRGPKTVAAYLFAVLAGIVFLPLGRSAKAQAPAKADPPDVATIVRNMEEAQRDNRQRYRAYLLTREYDFFHGESEQPASAVKAEISFVPPTTKSFKILDAQGSERGEKVVKNILEHEQRAEQTGGSTASITGDNYNFELLGKSDLDGRSCFLLQLNPKRKDPSLVNGKAWVDADTYLVRRVEGKMSKSPSWWVKDVNLAVRYGSLGGMWLQTGTTAVADVRLVGRYIVTSKALEMQTAQQVAARSFPQLGRQAFQPIARAAKSKSARTPSRQRRRTWPAQVVYDPGVFVPR